MRMGVDQVLVSGNEYQIDVRMHGVRACFAELRLALLR